VLFRAALTRQLAACGAIPPVNPPLSLLQHAADDSNQMLCRRSSTQHPKGSSGFMRASSTAQSDLPSFSLICGMRLVELYLQCSTSSVKSRRVCVM